MSTTIKHEAMKPIQIKGMLYYAICPIEFIFRHGSETFHSVQLHDGYYIINFPQGFNLSKNCLCVTHNLSKQYMIELCYAAQQSLSP